MDNEQKPLTDEQISKYKDYGKVTSSYEQTLRNVHKKPLYRNPLAFLALLVFLLMLYLVLKSSSPDKRPFEDSNTHENIYSPESGNQP